ncbi:MAG TPA: YidC/Oxa1 family membrane protein insertase [Gaiellaceae bacterium]|jgi:YidC/Oxa1 family membrane protein insertase|nr:YidC/Oxa1 family membrane protein insertase [Gaiellaceae bacterium]
MILHLVLGSPLTPIEDVLRHVLFWLHDSVGLKWAWAIVALTVMVRLLLVPLTVRQIHSMQNLQRHAPEMKEIQKKYKTDKKRQQEELMKFYRENNINPAASCLPLLAQFPVFIALYFVLRNFSKHPPGGELAVARGDFSWLGKDFIPDITAHASAHWSGYLLLAIYVVSQLVSTMLMSTTMERSQRILMMVLPLAFVTFLVNFPVGLVIYWVTTNLWTVGQGLITRRLMPRPQSPERRSSRTPPKEAAPAPAVAPEPAPAPATPSEPRRVKRKKKKARR